MSTTLTPNAVSRAALDATIGQPMHRAYAVVGPAFCPECDSRMNTIGWASYTESIRTLHRCVNVGRCFSATNDVVFNRTTYIQESWS